MKINSIVARYILRELFPPFAISLLFFTFVFLMTKILDITNLIVNYNINITVVLLLLLYSVPRFLEFVIPISIMIAVLVTFLKMTADNEILALKAAGASIYQLLPPVLLFCLIGCLLTGSMTIYGIPWSRFAFKKLTYAVAASHLNVGLKERTFNDGFKDVILYINKIDLKNSTLEDIFIEDQRDAKIASTVVSPKGKLFSDPQQHIVRLRLYNGIINQVNLERKTVNSINFGTYDLSFDLDRLVSAAKRKSKNEKEMNLSELRKHIKKTAGEKTKYNEALIVLYKKFSMPFACIALGLVAMPLGLQTSSAKRSIGLGAGFVFMLLYYLLLSAGFVFGKTGLYPPILGMWAPNIVTGGVGLFLLVKTADESLDLDTLLGSLYKIFSSPFNRLNR